MPHCLDGSIPSSLAIPMLCLPEKGLLVVPFTAVRVSIGRAVAAGSSRESRAPSTFEAKPSASTTYRSDKVFKSAPSDARCAQHSTFEKGHRGTRPSSAVRTSNHHQDPLRVGRALTRQVTGSPPPAPLRYTTSLIGLCAQTRMAAADQPGLGSEPVPVSSVDGWFVARETALRSSLALAYRNDDQSSDEAHVKSYPKPCSSPESFEQPKGQSRRAPAVSTS